MKISTILTKIEIGISVIPFLIIILFSGYYKLFFTYFLITFIHEMAHVIVAVIFGVKINRIKLSMFGFSADIGDYKYHKIYKQILILLAGPMTFLISNILIKQLYIYEIISLVTYHRALLTNKYILYFNLLPIYPLDGGRIVKIILDKIFTFRTAKTVSIIVSFLFIALFVIYSKEHKQYLMYIFLILNFILNIMMIDKEWREFLISRYFFNNKYKEKLHFKKDLYIYKNNYIIKEKEILNEKESIIDFLNQ